MSGPLLEVIADLICRFKEEHMEMPVKLGLSPDLWVPFMMALGPPPGLDLESLPEGLADMAIGVLDGHRGTCKVGVGDRSMGTIMLGGADA